MKSVWTRLTGLIPADALYAMSEFLSLTAVISAPLLQPKEKFEKDHCFFSHTEVLSFEEIIRLAKIFAANGIEKIRLTGGEPLLRKGIEFLIEELSKLKTWNGKPLDVAVTTNGAALSQRPNH